MVVLVARQGRQLQRYTSDGHRFVVGCIPYKFKLDKPREPAIAIDQALQVLVISSQKGQEIMFPRGGWESDESVEEAACREAMEEAGVLGSVEEDLGRWWYSSKSQDSRKLGIMFPLNVTEERRHWPEMGSRQRRWVTVAEARESCQQLWMREALDRLVGRLSCLPREHSASPPRSVAEQPWQEFGRLVSLTISLAGWAPSSIVIKDGEFLGGPLEPRSFIRWAAQYYTLIGEGTLLAVVLAPWHQETASDRGIRIRPFQPLPSSQPTPRYTLN